MRILFLCHRSLESTLNVGGIAEFITHLPPALQQQGIKSILYTPTEIPTRSLSGPEHLFNGMKAYAGPLAKPRLWTFSRDFVPLIELCKKENIDIVHAQGTYRCGFVAMKLSQKIGIPYVITSHSDISPINSTRIQRKNAQQRCRAILKNAAAVTHLTPFMAGLSHALYDTQDKSAIIGNGIDVDAWKPYHVLPEKNYLLAIGRLVPEKGFQVLIDAYAKLKNITTSLIIAGSGPHEHALQQQVKQHGLNLITAFNDFDHVPPHSVIFTGSVRGPLKKQLMSECKVVLFATQPHIFEEAFGIVQLEAMAAGKPLIASDTHATRYLQSQGLQTTVVKPDDTDAWALQITQLLQDEHIRKQMGTINLQHAHAFHWAKIAKQYANTYQLCGKTSKPLC